MLNQVRSSEVVCASPDHGDPAARRLADGPNGDPAARRLADGPNGDPAARRLADGPNGDPRGLGRSASSRTSRVAHVLAYGPGSRRLTTRCCIQQLADT